MRRRWKYTLRAFTPLGVVNSRERFGLVSTLQAHWRTNGLDGEAMTDLRDKLAGPLIPILREASDLSVEEATVAASTLVNAQMPVVEEAIREAVARFDEKMSVKLAKELAQANEEETVKGHPTATEDPSFRFESASRVFNSTRPRLRRRTPEDWQVSIDSFSESSSVPGGPTKNHCDFREDGKGEMISSCLDWNEIERRQGLRVEPVWLTHGVFEKPSESPTVVPWLYLRGSDWIRFFRRTRK